MGDDRQGGGKRPSGRTTGRLFELQIDRLAWGGRGVGRHRGKVVFVSKVVPGDRLLARAEKVKASFTEARMVGLLTPGEDRVDPRCPWFARCGGCQWLAAGYSRQVLEKDHILRSALRHHVEGARIDPIVRAAPPQAYRHRGDFHVRPTLSGARLGFYEEGSHRLVEVEGCLLFTPAFNAALGRMRSLLAKVPEARSLERITLAHSEDGTGTVAHLRLRPDGDAGAARSCAEQMKPMALKGMVATGGRRGPGLQWQGGDPHIWFHVPDSHGELRLRAEVRSFTQAHLAMNRRLVPEAVAWLGLSESDRVLDLFSGVGNFTLPMATRCKEVVAVEGSPTASADARFNAEGNGVANVVHMEEEAAKAAAHLAGQGAAFDAVLLDPPRGGAADLLQSLSRLAPTRILYVSCNLPSLGRDLDQLRNLGYRLVRAQGWDMFPQTYGLEALCLLEKS